MEKINWTDRVRNEEVLQSVKEERYILHTIKRRITGLAQPHLAWDCPLRNTSVKKRLKRRKDEEEDVAATT